MIIERAFTTDTRKPLTVRTLPDTLVVGDKNAHRIIVNIVDRTISGTAKAYLMRSDGETVLLSANLVDDGTVDTLLDSSCYSVAGWMQLIIRLYEADSITTLLVLNCNAIRSTTDIIVDPERIVPSLDDLLAQIDRMEQATAEAERVSGPVLQEVESLKDDISGINDNIFYASEKKLMRSDFVAGFITTTGVMTSGDANWSRTEYIPVINGQTYTSYIAGAAGVTCCAFYDKSKKFMPDISVLSNGSFQNISVTVGEDVGYIAYCCQNAYLDQGKVYFNIWENKPVIDAIKNNIGMIEKESDDTFMISDSKASMKNNFMYLSIPNEKNKIISFRGKVESFDKVRVGYIGDHYDDSWVEVDQTTVIMYHRNSDNGSAEIVHSVEHNLTIDKTFSITIDARYDKANVIVASLGGNCVIKDVPFTGCWGQVRATVYNAQWTECSLKFYPTDLEKNTWVFGDSYLSYWAKHCWTNGATNWLADGYPGCNTANAIPSFNMLVSKNKPKRIVWALGMNDADTSSAINSSWQNGVETIAAYCKENSIELILVTIPNVPQRNHSWKNHYIKNSGYKYIDVSKCVQDDGKNTWYDGLIGPDYLHPSDEGAKVIANYIMANLPYMFDKDGKGDTVEGTVLDRTLTNANAAAPADLVGAIKSDKADLSLLGGLKFQRITQEEYNLISAPDASTVYLIVG